MAAWLAGCRYHALHPGYLFKRIKELRADYTLRLVLVQVDVEDADKLVRMRMTRARGLACGYWRLMHARSPRPAPSARLPARAAAVGVPHGHAVRLHCLVRVQRRGGGCVCIHLPATHVLPTVFMRALAATVRRCCCCWCCSSAARAPAAAARYLETYKAYENKPATAIQERVEDAYLPKGACLRGYEWFLG